MSFRPEPERQRRRSGGTCYLQPEYVPTEPQTYI
jgi:hypothetical protein